GIIPSREIVRAHEKRVMVEHLSAGWLIVRIIQPHQSIPQERCKLAASFGNLARGSLGGFQYFRQICPHLQDRMAVAVKPGGIFTPLASREQRLWHLKLSQLPCQRHEGL